MTAILDAILNFSKRSIAGKGHPADSERGHSSQLKSIIKATLYDIARIHPDSAGLKTNIS
jgi:hypothetical protein